MAHAEVRTRWRTPAAYAAVAVLAVALVIPLVHVVHNDKVLTRTDTRDLAKDWLLENVPKARRSRSSCSARRAYFNTTARWGKPVRSTRCRAATEVELFAQKLSPALIDEFESEGYCYVVSASIQKGRVTKDPSEVPGRRRVLRGARRARREGRVIQPDEDGESCRASTSTSPTTTTRWATTAPAREIDIYRLSGGNCAPDGKT